MTFHAIPFIFFHITCGRGCPFPEQINSRNWPSVTRTSCGSLIHVGGSVFKKYFDTNIYMIKFMTFFSEINRNVNQSISYNNSYEQNVYFIGQLFLLIILLIMYLYK